MSSRPGLAISPPERSRRLPGPARTRGASPSASIARQHGSEYGVFLSQHDADRLVVDPKVGGKVAQAFGASQGTDGRFLVWRKLSAPRHLRGRTLRLPAPAT